MPSLLDAGQHAIATAIDLIRTPSVSGNEQAAIRLVTTAMQDAGFDDVHIDANGNALGVIGDGSHPRILVDGHVDTIPPHSLAEWVSKPLDAEIRDGSIFGLGACDQKASLACAIHGIGTALRRRTPISGTVALVASVCEEYVEGVALRDTAVAFAPDYAIITEPSEMRLCLGHRGRAKLDITVVGKASHSALPAKGINALERLASLVLSIAAHRTRSDERLGSRSFAFLDCVTAPFPSVSTLPYHARSHLDCRLLVGDTLETLRGDIRAAARSAWGCSSTSKQLHISPTNTSFTTWTGKRLKGVELLPAWLTQSDHPIVELASRALTEVGLDTTPDYYPFCTNGSLTAALLHIPTLGFGVGSPSLAHKPNESVTVNDMHVATNAFGSLVTQLTS